MEEHERLRKLFGYGVAGEPVPAVDPEEVKESGHPRPMMA